MTRTAVSLYGIIWLVGLVFGGDLVVAGNACHCPHGCRCAGGAPYGNTGCGPRYRGAVPEEGWCPDPCDHCGRWRGCNGTRPGLDMLAPWQMPPGRGFMNAEQVGYDTRRSCQRCQIGH